jgi:hypothetical protein
LRRCLKAMENKRLKTTIKFAFLILILLLATASPAQAVVAYRASGTFTSWVNGNTAVPYPATMAADDVCLLVVESENQAITLTTANGFVEVLPWSPQFAGIGAPPTNPASRLAVFWKRTTGGDLAPVVTDSGNHTTGRIHCFSGVIASGTPWDTGAGGNDGGANDTSATIPGSTTTRANTLVVLITSTSFNGTSAAQCTNATWANASLTNLTERSDNTNTAGLGGGHCMATGDKASAGLYATTTVTLANTSFKGAISLALMPPPVMSTIYGINITAIYRINPVNSVPTAVFSAAPFPFAGTAPAALAQCPDGMLYFTERNSSPYQLYQFNPNTQVITLIGPGIAQSLIRMSCHPTTGVLYGMPSAVGDLYIIDTIAGTSTAIPLTLPGSTSPAAGSGDIGFDADGTLYFVGETTAGDNTTERLWIINLATNTFDNVGAVTGLPAPGAGTNVANGIAFYNGIDVPPLLNGDVLLSLSFGIDPARLYRVSPDGGAATALGVLGAMAATVLDVSSVNVLQVTKTNTSPFISPTGAAFNYSVVLTAGAAVNNAVFTDPAITNLTVSNVTCAVSGVGGAICPVLCAPNCPITDMQNPAVGLTIPFMPAGGIVTFTITANVTGNPTSQLANTATVTLSGQSNSASEPTPINKAIRKSKTVRWREVFQ